MTTPVNIKHFLPDLLAGRSRPQTHQVARWQVPENMSQLRELSVYLGDRAGQWWPTAQQE
jgi:hypothetical protein